MSSESQETPSEMRSILERLIRSRNRDLSMFIPFLLGFSSTDPGQTRPESDQTRPDQDHNLGNNNDPDDQIYRDRIVLINPLTQGMVVIEGEGLDSLFRGVPGKDGPPPALKSAVEGMPRVEILEGEEERECVICLEECKVGGFVKEMPCKHRFHGPCIEKWLGLHGSCPVCRYMMPVEEENGGKKEEGGGERRRGQREIWVSFSFGRRRTDERESGDDVANQRDEIPQQNGDSEMGN